MPSPGQKSAASSALAGDTLAPVEWRINAEPVDYDAALAAMGERVRAIASGEAPELAWLLEHPPLYTAGTSAKPEDLLDPDRFPVHQVGRGGRYTYHGPGQRVAYLMLDLKRRGADIRAYVSGLEQWIIDTLAAFNIEGIRRPDNIGIWVPRPDKGADRFDKIAAIGVRVSRWISYHGISINLDPDLEHFAGIVPCGVADQGVTSFEDLGQLVSMPELDMALSATFEPIFGAAENPRYD